MSGLLFRILGLYHVLKLTIFIVSPLALIYDAKLEKTKFTCQVQCVYCRCVYHIHLYQSNIKVKIKQVKCDRELLQNTDVQDDRLVMTYKIANKNGASTKKHTLNPQLRQSRKMHSSSFVIYLRKTQQRQEQSFSLVRYLTGTGCHSHSPYF